MTQKRGRRSPVLRGMVAGAAGPEGGGWKHSPVLTERESEMSLTSTMTPARALQARLPGIVHLPGCAEYSALTTAWDLAVAQFPVAVADPRTAADVAAVVREAARQGLRIAPQTTGHAAAPLGRQSLADVVLLRTAGLRSVRIDPERRTARIGGGAIWADVIGPAAEHGLAALHGSAADVGVVGYTLGGGLSFYSRQYGLAANSVVAIELVTAAGNLVRVDADTRPDLFWALRGGVAANFGVVTALEMSLVPLTDVYAGMMLWEIGHADPVLRTWVRWAENAPDAATTALRIMRFPADPGLPRFCQDDGSSLSTARSWAPTTPPRSCSPLCGGCCPRSTPSPGSRSPHSPTSTWIRPARRPASPRGRSSTNSTRTASVLCSARLVRRLRRR